jgi:hypothetical protein
MAGEAARRLPRGEVADKRTYASGTTRRAGKGGGRAQANSGSLKREAGALARARLLVAAAVVV